MFSKRIATVIALGVCASAHADGLPDTKAAATVFGQREHIIDASLSPDGNKIALVSPGPAQSTVVQVLDFETGAAKAVNYANGDPMTLTGCGWSSNRRIVCSLYGVANYEGPQASYTRLVALNADGSQPTSLGVQQTVQDYINPSDGRVIDWRDGADGTVLIARNYVPMKSNVVTVGSKAEGLGVDLIDTASGKTTHIESPDPIVGRYIGDGAGNIRIKGQEESFRNGNYVSNGRTSYYYRVVGDRAWKPFSIYDSVKETGLYPLAVDSAKNQAYVLEKQNGRDALFAVALDGTLKKTLVFADPDVDVDGVLTIGRSGRVIGARFTKEKPEVKYFDAAYETLFARIGKALPKLPLLTILDSSADETKHLVFAQSDTDPGRYFRYDSKTRVLDPVGTQRPDMTGMPVGTVESITYTAGDGTKVPGYLTLPPGGARKGLPAIVMPHGGPASRDVWGFDWLAQYFVARGYAVLQPNFRGSSGYGDTWFQENGFRSWKTAIGDVNDAGHWLVKEGIADPAKLAIVGWSYGGYAALQANVLDPDLFKAVVAVAPVTDLGMLRAEAGLIGYGRLQQDYIGEGPQIDEGSPARHADRFKAPVLMFHGTKDINVDVAESRAMDKALKKAGKKTRLVVYPKIDHQLRDGQVRTDMLTQMGDFLKQSLGS